MEIYVSEHNGKMVAVLLDDEMKIVKPVYDFLRFQQQKGRAINTLKAYGTDLCLLWTFLKKNGYAYDQVTPRVIAEFIDYLRGGDGMLSLYRESVRSNRTINRILSTVHTFYRYQADMYEIDNPILMHEINRPFNMFKGILAHTRSDNKITSSISLPFIFKLGVEKGRTAYYLMIGMVCGASVLASSFFRSDLQAEIRPNTILIVMSIVGVGVYILSWLLSIQYTTTSVL